MFFVHSDVVGLSSPPPPLSRPRFTDKDDPDDTIDSTFSIVSASLALYKANFKIGSWPDGEACPWTAWAQVNISGHYAH